ncbi:MAG: DinB family protein [Ignavibacterium sp.]|jgi:hypothetical protein|nr:DinB family protein [Ignavibacterium sp.]
MKTILELKNQFISDTESQLKELKYFQALTDYQLNWKISGDSWSIAECIDHLCVTNKLYIDEFEKQFSQKQIKADCSKTSVKHRFLGRFIIKSVDPDNLKKIKTFPVFQPSGSNHTKEVLTRYSDLQNEFINLLSSVKDLDLNKYKMSSPASKLIKENFCDVLEIIRLHDKRHFLQAKRVIDHPNFPRE